MVELFCVVVGEKGSAFPVDIDTSQSVGKLKKVIKEENEKTITCDARELQLFLARKGDELVEKLYYALTKTNFVLLSAPAGSGKTSLLTLFARRHPELRYVPIAFDDFNANATDLLAGHGVDVVRKTCRIPGDKMCVFMLDDCQRQYHDIAFWTALIKGSSSWLLPHIRFIISATHLLETDAPDSPIAFGSIPWKVTRDDFLISDEEAHQFFDFENGLPSQLRFPTLVEVIIRECNGHIGSLRSSCDILFEHYSKAVAPVEDDVFVYYLSGIFVNQLTRCFGSGHTTPASRNLQLFLIKCLVRDPTCGPLGMQLDEDEKQCFTRLMKAGIVRQDGDGYVMFVSPLAERYYNKWLFPNRADCNPKSLQELIRKVIGSMSASVLRQSVVYTDNFPKEAAFQHQFMAALALHTLQTCYICPELSRVFPDSPRQLDQRISGEIDFYLNGSLRWGIELLVNGDGIGEHMARFAEDGKYAALAVKDYAVVDLRCNQTGRITNVIRKPERITVFFKAGDFSSCRCIFGLDENPEPIILKH
ncbi:Hypothetical protein PHPALM_17622 [Phytophthora palmivora]|uniref:Crinkler effector protein N-terminal domain-containing protein n=1 Tax=Phytophthora palmivora TaxID=4796 RepID=A0A2P4XLY6_9STRA|nr:Hypothetical protein PHPALM_17622 [Phytophthora palmivora]